MAKGKKRKTPSRVKYERDHPTVSLRVTKELKDMLQGNRYYLTLHKNKCWSLPVNHKSSNIYSYLIGLPNITLEVLLKPISLDVFIKGRGMRVSNIDFTP